MKKGTRKIIIFVLIVFVLTGMFFIKYIVDRNNKEHENIVIDEYNFKELKKAKTILESILKESNKFYTIKEFNELYNSNIKPIKNCYYVSTSNGNEKYIFGFELKSQKYMKKYGNEYYAYPKYDLPVDYFCGGSKSCNDDLDFNIFLATISNPCKY